METLSFDTKVMVAFQLSIAITEQIEEGLMIVSAEVSNMLYGHADGMVSKHYNESRNGNDVFSLTESSLDKDLSIMEGLCNSGDASGVVFH
jgi:hypothetical protein